MLSREQRLKEKLEKIENDFHYVIIDCPPSLGLLTINAFTAANSLLIPIQCEYYALEGVGQLMNTVNLIKKQLNKDLYIEGVVLTMSDVRTNLSNQVIKEVKTYFKDNVYKTIIPRNVKLSEAPSFGKGLDALLINNVVEEEKVHEGEVVQKLKLIEVEPNRDQPRRNFDEEAIEDLSNSIKEYGVIQPIIVTKQDNYYKIVAGERRWRASKKAGLTEIPAIVRDYDEQRNNEIALIENIQREDLNPIEKATAIRELLDKYNLTQQKLADKLGISRSGLANTVRILNLQPEVIELVKEGKLTEGHCKALLGIEDPEKQYQAAKYIIENGETVRDVEKQAKIKKKANSTVKNRYEPIYRDIEDSFRSFFGTKVKIDAKQRSGKIIIQYSSNEDLERILGLVK